MSVHIFRAPNQPATRFLIEIDASNRHWFQRRRRSLVPCYSCRIRRWAQNCTVQAYYDSIRYFCRPGKGCKGAT